MKKMYLNAAGGLLAGLFLFSCSTEELATEQTINNPNQFSDISEIDNDKIISDILSKNTEILNPDYNKGTSVNEDGLLTGKNTSNLSLPVDEICYTNGGGVLVCEDDFYEFDGGTLPCPYNSTRGSALIHKGDVSNGVLGHIQFRDPNYGFYYHRYELPLATNDIINISSHYDSFHLFPVGPNSSNNYADFFDTITDSDDRQISESRYVNIYLKDFNTTETVMTIAENITNPSVSFGFHFGWRIPNTVPTGEYYVEIQDITDASLKNYEHYITKLIVENTEEPAFVTNFLSGVISAPGPIYNYNLGVNTGEITLEWDKDIFDEDGEDYVNINMSSINFTTPPFELIENHSKWVRNNGTYTIPADDYGAFAAGFITIQNNTTSTATNFSIQN